MSRQNPNGLSIIEAVSPIEKSECFEIRHQVFIKEQGISPALEFDEFDSKSIHYLATLDNVPAACARVYAETSSKIKIGRFAVIITYRKQGIGAALLGKILEDARNSGYREAYLGAQLSAVEFYRRLGFKEFSHEFEDAGIPHRSMKRKL